MLIEHVSSVVDGPKLCHIPVKLSLCPTRIGKTCLPPTHVISWRSLCRESAPFPCFHHLPSAFVLIIRHSSWCLVKSHVLSLLVKPPAATGCLFCGPSSLWACLFPVRQTPSMSDYYLYLWSKSGLPTTVRTVLYDLLFIYHHQSPVFGFGIFRFSQKHTLS